MNILALGHNASRTGAPILLLNLLQRLKSDEDCDVRCLLGAGGALETEYQREFDSRILGQAGERTIAIRILHKATNGLVRRDPIKNWLRKFSPHVLYANTVASLPALRRVRRMYPGVPFVVHVHELTWLLRRHQRASNIEEILCEAGRVFAASNAVRDALITEFNLPQHRIERVYEHLCREGISCNAADSREEIRRHLGIRPDRVLCLSVGTQEWRKGPEFIPLIAKACLRKQTNTEFLWIGAETADRSAVQLTLDAEKLGVGDRVRFLGEVTDPAPYFSAADIFVLPSREDPYPLSMLEAGLFGLPVVCFRDSGGATEFVSSGAGIAVDYLDTVAMAEAINGLAADGERRRAMGKIGRRHVQRAHRLEDAAGKIYSTLKEVACMQSRPILA